MSCIKDVMLLFKHASKWDSVTVWCQMTLQDPSGLCHPPAYTEAPGDHVGDKIRDLHPCREIAVHEKRPGNDPTCAVPTDRCFGKLSLHLVDQQVAFRLLKFVEHHNALLLRRGVLQEVEEPLE